MNLFILTVISSIALVTLAKPHHSSHKKVKRDHGNFYSIENRPQTPVFFFTVDETPLTIQKIAATHYLNFHNVNATVPVIILDLNPTYIDIRIHARDEFEIDEVAELEISFNGVGGLEHKDTVTAIYDDIYDHCPWRPKSRSYVCPAGLKYTLKNLKISSESFKSLYVSDDIIIVKLRLLTRSDDSSHETTLLEAGIFAIVQDV